MSHTPADYSVLHLSLIEGIGPATIAHLINNLGQEVLRDLYAMSAAQIMMVGKVSKGQAQAITTGLADLSLLEQELALGNKHNVRWMTILDSAYPAMLKQIYAPPSVLYWYGTLNVTDKALAVIGSCAANAYAQRVINNFVPPLVQAGVVIVSGGALGADTMAHRAALEARGVTTVVLGSGLLHWYPGGNKRLFQEIIDNNGAIVSSFPLSTEPLPGNFPARNRIIAGLAQATLVVQAAAKSGARITAEFALDQGREVMAVPGAVDDPLSHGCHELIAQGALLAACPLTVLRALGMQQSESAVDVKPEQILAQQSMDTHERPQRDPLLVFCSQPRSTDEIQLYMQLSSDKVTAKLFQLQLSGSLEQDFTGKWCARI